MRGELNLISGDVELLEQLAGVAVAENGVGREVVRRVHEVRLGGGRLACAADSGLGVADDAVIEIDDAGLNERSQREDDRGRVAARVGHQPGFADFVAVKLGATIDGFGLKLRGVIRVCVLELVDLAVGGVLETPCAAEIDDLDAS